jgi:predicted peptidase
MQQAIYGESLFNYLLYLPKDYSETKKYPLIFFLHGAGERGNDLSVLKVHSIPKVFDGDVDYQAIVVSPQCKEGLTWNSQIEKLYEFIKEIISKYNVLENAVSITGISMGAYGTWQTIMDNPELFSCSAPICGGGLAWRAGVLKDLPLRIYHGEKDLTVDVFYSKDIYKVLKNAGAKNVELFLYPEVGHNVWNQAYEETDLIDWLITTRR